MTGMWKPIVGYGALLAVGAITLQWLDYQRLARLHSGDVVLFGVATEHQPAVPGADDLSRNLPGRLLVPLVSAGLLRIRRFLPAR